MGIKHTDRFQGLVIPLHVRFLISEEDLGLASETRLDHSGFLCGRSFVTVKRGRESF